MSNTDIDKLQSQTVDWLRYPLMLLIVLIHADTPLYYSMPQAGVSAVFLYITRTVIRLAVPAFFMFSGYWFFRKPETFTIDDYRSKIRKRVRTLFVPYVFWNFFVWGFQMLVVVFQGHASWIPSDTFHFKNIIDVIIGYGEGYQGMPKDFQLWFLRDLMVVCLLAPQLFLLLKGRRPYVLLLFAFLYLMPFPEGLHPIFKRFPAALLFFSVGAYMGIHKQNMVEMARKVPMWLSVAVTTAALVVHVWQCMTYGRYTSLAENVFSIVSVIPTLQIASLLVERRQLKPRPFIADSNFLLFAIHPTIMYYLLVEPLSGKISNTPLHFWLVYAAELLVPVVVCIVLYALMHRIMPKTTSLLTGGRS